MLTGISQVSDAQELVGVVNVCYVGPPQSTSVRTRIVCPIWVNLPDLSDVLLWMNNYTCITILESMP